MGALASPLNGALPPEVLMAGSAACRLSEVRVIGSSGSRQQPMVNDPLPTPEENGRLAGCRGPPHTGPTDMLAVALAPGASGLLEGRGSEGAGEGGGAERA